MAGEVSIIDGAHVCLTAAGTMGVRIAEKVAGKLQVVQWLPDRPFVEAGQNLADMVFVVSGMEDEAVARRTVELAALARQFDTCRFSIGVVTGTSVARNAGMGESLQQLGQLVDAMFLVSHRDLKPLDIDAPQVMGPLAQEEYLAGSVVEDIARLLTEPGIICVDFEDVRAIMCDGSSRACLGVGLAGAGEGPSLAAQKALSRIREQGMDPNGKGAFLVLIKGSSNMTMDDFDEMAMQVHSGIHPDANILTALLIDDSLGGNFRVMVLAKMDALPFSDKIEERILRFVAERE